MKSFLFSFGGVVAIIVVFLVMFFSALGFRYYTAEIRGKVDAQEQIQSGSNRIAQYNHFFNLCAAVQGHEAQLDALKTELQNAISDKDRSRIQASITGVTAHRAQTIAQYNADASKNYTSGQFLASNLPYQLRVDSYPDGGGTKCAIY